MWKQKCKKIKYDLSTCCVDKNMAIMKYVLPSHDVIAEIQQG